MAVKVKQEEAYVEVSATVLGQKKTEARKIKIRPFSTEPAHVGVKYGTTFKNGDDNYVKVDVMLSCPCYKEEMLDVYQQVQKIADKLLTNEVNRIKGE
jgi:GTP cyclohydrolase FolE2